MENNNQVKNNGKGKNIVIVFLILIVLGLSGFIVYDKYVKEEVNTNQTKNTTVKEKETITDEEKYNNYAKKLKEEMGKKYSTNIYSSYSTKNDAVPNGYEVKLDKDGSLTIKYGGENNSKNISSNVLSFYVISTGQGGLNTLYFIKDNGTVGEADIENNYSNTIKIEENINNLKNIVSVIGGSFSDGYSGTTGPIFIDINGNIFSENFTN